MEFAHRTRFARTSSATSDSTLAPGKRTLTEQLPVQLPERATPPGATSETNTTVPATPAPLPAEASSRPTLQMLFGFRPAPAEHPAQVHAAAGRGTAGPTAQHSNSIERAFGPTGDHDAAAAGHAPGAVAPVEVARPSEVAGAPGSTLLGAETAAMGPAVLAARRARRGDTAQTAAEGLTGAAQALPHREQIQRAFGHHDVDDVRAFVGGAAASASDRLGAEAYATGDAVAFRDSPDLHTAAHEAAHVVQQRGGVQLKDKLGRAGDAYEAHADAVADAVTGGRSAEGLLDTMAGPRSRASSDGAVQRLASYPEAVGDLRQVPEPRHQDKPYAYDYHLLLENLQKYDLVAAEEDAARSVLTSLDRLTKAILGDVDEQDRHEQPEFFHYVVRLTDAIGRERVMRGWNKTEANPRHGDRVRQNATLRATPNDDLDPEQELAKLRPEELRWAGIADLPRDRQLAFVRQMNQRNKYDDVTPKDRLTVKDFREGKANEPSWYLVENENGGQRGFIREDEMAVTDAHALRAPALFEQPPAVDDIQQGSLGDCFLLSALGTIVRRDPGYIQRMVIDGRDTVSVRFYRAAGAVFIPEWVTVEKTAAVEEGKKRPRFASKPWVAMVEKAYATWAGKGLYGRITGGGADTALQDLLGKEAAMGWKDRVHDKDLAQHTREVLEESPGRATTIGTKGGFKNAGPHPQLYPTHAYEVVRATRTGLVLRNPHGTDKSVTAEFELTDALVNEYFDHSTHTTESAESGPGELAQMTGIVVDAQADLARRRRALEYLHELATSGSKEVGSHRRRSSSTS
jgi:calpain family cysteine protease/uncharacterized protein DUF4157